MIVVNISQENQERTKLFNVDDTNIFHRKVCDVMKRENWTVTENSTRLAG